MASVLDILDTNTTEFGNFWSSCEEADYLNLRRYSGKNARTKPDFLDEAITETSGINYNDMQDRLVLTETELLSQIRLDENIKSDSRFDLLRAYELEESMFTGMHCNTTVNSPILQGASSVEIPGISVFIRDVKSFVKKENLYDVQQDKCEENEDSLKNIWNNMDCSLREYIPKQAVDKLKNCSERGRDILSESDNNDLLELIRYMVLPSYKTFLLKMTILYDLHDGSGGAEELSDIIDGFIKDSLPNLTEEAQKLKTTCTRGEICYICETYIYFYEESPDNSSTLVRYVQKNRNDSFRAWKEVVYAVQYLNPAPNIFGNDF